MKKIFIILAFITLTACGSVKLLSPSQADADRVSTKYPNLMVSELKQGKVLYEQNCNACHGLKKPESRDEEKWNKVVPRMVQKVNKKAGKEEINDQDQQLLLKYLITMSTVQKK